MKGLGGVMWRWLLLCVPLLVIVGCGDDSNPRSGGSYKIPDTTVVLDRETLEALDSVSDDLATWRFSRSTPLLARLRERDVIVSDVFEPKLPAGALRRVQAVDRSDGVVVTTVPASLAEAIERANIRQRIPLRPDQIQTFTAPAGVVPSAGPTGLYFGLNDVVLFDGDGGPSVDDQVVMNGNIAIEPELELVVELDGFSLKEATVAIVGEVSGNVNIDARRSATLPGTPITLATLELGTYTFFVGPVPVVVSSYVELQVGVEGEVTAKMNVGFREEAAASIGFGFKNGSFTPIGGIDATASMEVQSFQDGVVGNARLFAGPRLWVALYGIPVGFAKLRAHVEANVDAKANPWWCLSAGMEGSAGIDIDINIDFWIFDITIELVEWETPLLEDSVDLGCAPGPAPSSQPGSGGGTPEEAIQTFARSYGGDNIDHFNAILPTQDGGALLAGSTNSFTSTPRDAWLVKVDALGHVGWQTAYRDLHTATDLLELGDGYLVSAGQLGAAVDAVNLLRVDVNGSIVWARQYGHADGIGPSRVVKTSDGGFLVAGTRSVTTRADFYAARFDANGTLSWAKSYGGDDDDDAHAAIATSDGGFLLVGQTSSFGVVNTGAWVVKINAAGNIEWQRLFDPGGNFYGFVATQSPLGGYLVGGHTVNAGLLLRLEPSGAVRWARHYDAGTANDYLMAAAAYPDGSFGAVGSRGLGPAAELWVLCISDAGNVLWSRALGGADHESAGGTPPFDRGGQPVAVAADGGLLVAGKTRTWGSGAEDAWLLKLTKNGYVELDLQGGASSTALAGAISLTTLPGTTTAAAALSFALTDAPLAIERLSTQASVLRQGGLP
ncbi:MAG TPA: hypothetical protein VI072_03895 [Polyangiaceae bacterium]